MNSTGSATVSTTARLDPDDGSLAPDVTRSTSVAQEQYIDDEDLQSDGPSGGDVDGGDRSVEGINWNMAQRTSAQDANGQAGFDNVVDSILRSPLTSMSPSSSFLPSFGHSQSDEPISAIPLSSLCSSALNPSSVPQSPQPVEGLGLIHMIDDVELATNQGTSLSLITMSLSRNHRSLSPGSTVSSLSPVPLDSSDPGSPSNANVPVLVNTHSPPDEQQLIKQTRKRKATQEDPVNKDSDVNKDTSHDDGRRKRKRSTITQPEPESEEDEDPDDEGEDKDAEGEDEDVIMDIVDPLEEVSSIPRFEVHGDKEVRFIHF